MNFKLPGLPYDYSALEPHIDEQTMKIHHGKHHAGYVNNLNALLKDQKKLSNPSVEELLVNIKSAPKNIRQAVINNAGGHANHSLFWKIMSPKGGGKPEKELLRPINDVFGNFETFKEKFTEKAMGLFGSGWVFLVLTKDKKLKIKRQSFQNSPLMQGNTPFLGLDVWEHAYYLKYQNRRAEYIRAWWNVVDWEKVENLYKASLS